MTDEEGGPGRGARIQVLDLPCPVCGETLRHRVVHVRAGPAGARPLPPGGGGAGPLEGIARCVRCRSAHPFVLRSRSLQEVTVIVSEGPSSHRGLLHLPPDRELEVGGTLRVRGRPVRLSRLEGPQGRSLHRGRPGDVVALWAVPDDRVQLRVSVVERARTVPLHLELEADREVRVGEVHRVEGERIEIVGIRGRGTTFQRPGEALPARDVQRVYARWARSPPGGRRAWSRSREMPRS